MSRSLTTFYRGRPTKGSKLQAVSQVIWDDTWDPLAAYPGYPGEPFLRDSHGRPIWRLRGLHRVRRQVSS